MLNFQTPVHFYQQSHFWEIFGYSCLGLAVVFESIAFFFEAYEDDFEKWCRWAGRLGISSLSLSTNGEIDHYLKKRRLWAGGLGILFLIFLVGADIAAGHFRSIEDRERNALLASQGNTIKELTDQAGDAKTTIAQLGDRLGGAKTLILQLQGQIDDAKDRSAKLLALAQQESRDIEQLQQKSEVASLALRAEDDDALAFDRLREYAALPAADPRQEPAEAAVNSIVLARNSDDWKFQSWQKDMPEKQAIEMFNSLDKYSDPRLRRTAIDALTQYSWPDVAHKSVFRRLILIAGSDRSLNVREAAYRTYGSIIFSWWLSWNSRVFNLMTPEGKKSMHMSGIRVLELETLKKAWAYKESKNFFPE